VSDDVNDWQAHKDPASHSRPAVPKPTSYIDESIMLRSMPRYDINPLYQYVAKVMGDKEAMRHWHCIMWHIPANGAVPRFTGKWTHRSHSYR
jgi:hypothetical protein